VLAFVVPLTLYQLPLLLVCGIGLAFAVSRRHRYARAAARVIVGLALLIASSAMQIVRYVLLTGAARTVARTNGGPFVEPAASWGLSLAGGLLLVVGVVALATAVFVDR
jgi:hypothetical protein